MGGGPGGAEGGAPGRAEGAASVQNGAPPFPCNGCASYRAAVSMAAPVGASWDQLQRRQVAAGGGAGGGGARAATEAEAAGRTPTLHVMP